MAAGPAPSTKAKYNQLSEFYLALWKQLDLASDGTRWLQIRPENAVDLSEEVRQRAEDFGPGLSGPDLSTALKDFEKTKEFVFSNARIDFGELVGFREYLRDLALRYSELADEPASSPR